jgi:zinc transport system substrate-binding protein
MKGHRHDDGDEGIHDGGRPDPHIWLSPRLVMLQARNILLDLSEIFPDEAFFFRKNYRAFLQEIGEIDTLLLERFGPKSGNRQFLVFHPSWGYFARDYGLEQIPIEIEGKAPRQKDLLRLMETGRGKGWKTVFVQPQFSDKSATALAQNLGATIVPLDPLAENWGENILMAASLIEESLR